MSQGGQEGGSRPPNCRQSSIPDAGNCDIDPSPDERAPNVPYIQTWEPPSFAEESKPLVQLFVTEPQNDQIDDGTCLDDNCGAGASQGKDQTLHIVNEVDDAYSDAEQSFLERGPIAPSWARGRPGNFDDDSDKSNRDPPAYGDADDFYDSDLDSVASRTGRVVREHHKKMRKWRSMATSRFENMLLECIVNIDSIPPNYENIFVNRNIIDQLEKVTRLSLNRPKAFSHGVLKGNRVTGAVLYGPPGTGKTLLAKGLAKESRFNMLAISTAELWQKCHGEDEKVIKALFSLGRKLNPCIIFLDEADAMLGARKAGEKRHIRSMLNQFLMEWDGLTSGLNSPFMLLATNRPFDLDPAVLRRAPVHIHLDIPTLWERQKILELLLKGETLGRDVDCSTLAQYTHRFTGSDLKNLCVSAATNCVSEQESDTARRVLWLRHFRQAMTTIKATALSSTMKNEFQKFQGTARHDDVDAEEE